MDIYELVPFNEQCHESTWLLIAEGHALNIQYNQLVLAIELHNVKIIKMSRVSAVAFSVLPSACLWQLCYFPSITIKILLIFLRDSFTFFSSPLFSFYQGNSFMRLLFQPEYYYEWHKFSLSPKFHLWFSFRKHLCFYLSDRKGSQMWKTFKCQTYDIKINFH